MLYEILFASQKYELQIVVKNCYKRGKNKSRVNVTIYHTLYFRDISDGAKYREGLVPTLDILLLCCRLSLKGCTKILVERKAP